jgi:hypothetical protein
LDPEVPRDQRITLSKFGLAVELEEERQVVIKSMSNFRGRRMPVHIMITRHEEYTISGEPDAFAHFL